jgi:hypothetical protein
MYPVGMYMQKKIAVDDPGGFLGVSHGAGQEVKNFSSEETRFPGLITIRPSALLLTLYQARSRGAGPDNTSPLLL